MRHLSDDSLELYSLGRLTEPERTQAEEHLLMCDECRKRLEATDAYIAAMREGLRRKSKAATDTE
jgi:anti-sigma factor RsiW